MKRQGASMRPTHVCKRLVCVGCDKTVRQCECPAKDKAREDTLCLACTKKLTRDV